MLLKSSLLSWNYNGTVPLHQIYDESLIQIYNRLAPCIFVTNCVACAVHVVLIFKFTPYASALFKLFHTIELACIMVVLVVYVGTQPVVLGHFAIIYAQPLLCKLSAEVVTTAFFTALYFVVVANDMIVCIALMRHFALVRIFEPHRLRRYQVLAYGLNGCSNMAMLAGLTTTGVLLVRKKWEAMQLLFVHVEDVERILAGFDGLLWLSLTDLLVYVPYVVGSTCWGAVKLPTLSWILWRNRRFRTESVYNWSKATEQKYAHLDRVIVVQYMTHIVCGGPVFLWMVVYVLYPEVISNSTYFVVVLSLAASFPAVNLCMTVLLIKPYRNLLTRCFPVLQRKSVRTISGRRSPNK